MCYNVLMNRTEQDAEIGQQNETLEDIANIGCKTMEAAIAKEYDKLKKGIKVVIGGPPHSGKTVFKNALIEDLGGDNVFRYCAAPDDDGGTWYQNNYNNPEAREKRIKGTYNPRQVAFFSETIKNWDQTPIMVIDIGGKITEENAKIIEGATHAIVLASDLSKVKEWQDFFEENHLDVIAKLHSHFDGSKDIQLPSEPEDDHLVASVHHLERGVEAADRESIKKVAGLISSLAKNNTAYKEAHPGYEKLGNVYEIKIPADVKDLPSEVVERKITDAQGNEQINTSTRFTRDAIKLIYEKDFDCENRPVLLNGVLCGWMAIAMTFACEDAGCANVRINSPNGFVEVKPLPESEEIDPEWWEEPELKGEMDGKPVYSIFNKGRSSVKIVNPEDLDTMTVPKLPEDAIVSIETGGPNWLKASIAAGYKDKVAAIAAFQPGEGSTIAWSKDFDDLGKVIE